jgi:beta-aspartyl-peptidase (threonine type)
VDERASLVVEGDGTARPDGAAGHLWLAGAAGGPAAKGGAGPAAGLSAVRITGIGPGSRLDLATLKVDRPAFAGTARVAKGQRRARAALP